MIGQLDLSLLDTSAEGLKIIENNEDNFLYEHNDNRSFIDNIKLDDLNDLSGIFNDNHNDSTFCKNEKSKVSSDILTSPRTQLSPRPPASPRSKINMVNKLVENVHMMKDESHIITSPRRKEDEADEALIVKMYASMNLTSPKKCDFENYDYQSVSKLVDVERSKKEIPKFYHPLGFSTKSDNSNILEIKNIFSKYPGNEMKINDFHKIAVALGKPKTWGGILFKGCIGVDYNDDVTICYNKFVTYWIELISSNHDDAAQFVRLLVDGANKNKEENKRAFLIPSDFKFLLQYIINTIEDLDNLREASFFHELYIDTVTVRIFWRVCRFWDGKISIEEIRKSNFLSILETLHEKGKLDNEPYYFSYIHFYVIYCKFWDLDDNHDMRISSVDMKKYGNGALTSRIIERIFLIRNYHKHVNGFPHYDTTLSYTEFVQFLLADENKRHFKSMEYWFRILDIDGDGKLSFEEMEYFHEDILKELNLQGIASNSMDDTLCSLFDMIRPSNDYYITLADIKRSKMGAKFFNNFVNVTKFIEQEVSECEVSFIREDNDIAEWDDYCKTEYQSLTPENDGKSEVSDEHEISSLNSTEELGF
uniref:EF-hand domain-containing protein n=1 Tax=Parastrongyloides trichosuri TaxID=131310 RepID=A0A0N4ZQ94_PARTI